jgi:hypothetical protein
MTLPLRQPDERAAAALPPADEPDAPANDAVPPAPVWPRVVEALAKATSWYRDGESAARHSEIRRRLRALARAARTFADPGSR